MSLYQTIFNYFQEDNWPVQPVAGVNALHMRFQGKNGTWNCLAEVQEEHQLFVFYSAYPVSIPLEKRAAVAEFLMRANFGLTTGSFELDFEEGEARFRTSLIAAGGPLSNVMIKTAVYINLLSMDRYFPGLEALLSGTTAPRQAVALCEGK